MENSEFIALAKRIRRTVLKMIYQTKSPHIGSSYSIIEILIALYFDHLRISVDNPADPNRDRLILSKGHGCPALYAVLEAKGFLTSSELNGFAINNGTLEQHPRMDINKSIEVSTGSLGHGLSIGAGIALASKINCQDFRVFVLMSDGEMNEGSTWEAIQFAAQHKLANLIAIVDYNKMQALGFTKDIIDLHPLALKLESFRWDVRELDGHDFTQIFETLSTLSPSRPNALILHTVKGKGVSFMENQLRWHYRAPDQDEYELAMAELSE